MIIVHGVGRKLIGANDMKDDEKVLLIVSPSDLWDAISEIPVEEEA